MKYIRRYSTSTLSNNYSLFMDALVLSFNPQSSDCSSIYDRSWCRRLDQPFLLRCIHVYKPTRTRNRPILHHQPVVHWISLLSLALYTRAYCKFFECTVFSYNDLITCTNHLHFISSLKLKSDYFFLNSFTRGWY